MAGYANAPMQSIDIDPRSSGLGAIGHMGYFRRTGKPLWEQALQWFAQHPLVAVAPNASPI